MYIHIYKVFNNHNLKIIIYYSIEIIIPLLKVKISNFSNYKQISNM